MASDDNHPDPLAKFRSNRSFELVVNDAPPPPLAQKEAYLAFRKSSKRQSRLGVRPALQAWSRLHYPHLLQIIENGRWGTELVLEYNFGVVVISGRNLKEIVDAIDAETCEFIEQYDPYYYDMPTDSTAPFIEKLEIYTEYNHPKTKEPTV
jgi:hypothetical protein